MTPGSTGVLSRRQAILGGAAVLAASGMGVRAVRAASDVAPVIDPEVRAATARGRVRVLVELRLSGGSPAAGDAVAQERAIASAQQAVLARLSKASHRLLHRYTSVPLLSLEIDADALRALEVMGDVVARVRADRLRAPSTPQ